MMTLSQNELLFDSIDMFGCAGKSFASPDFIISFNGVLTHDFLSLLGLSSNSLRFCKILSQQKQANKTIAPKRYNL